MLESKLSLIESGLSPRRSRKLKFGGEHVVPGRQCERIRHLRIFLPEKWLELLKDITPEVKRAAVLCDPSLAPGIAHIGELQAVGPIGLDLSAIDVRHATEIECDAAELAHGTKGGLIVTATQFGAKHPDLIAAIAGRGKLPAAYPFRYHVTAGVLIFYGPDPNSAYPRVAVYVHRILKGEDRRPASAGIHQV
jgi:putative ABC transport system substrate-binding protein